MKTPDTTILSRDLLPSYTRLYYRKHHSDLYVLLVDELTDFTEVIEVFSKWSEKRDKQREQLKGLVFVVFDDVEGPKVIYNNLLKEEIAILLAVQGQTVSSMGRLKKFKVGFKEPLNVPNRSDLVHMSYDFLQPAPESADPRIAKMGRISNLYLIFDRSFSYLNEEHFRLSIEGYLDEWVYNHFSQDSGQVYPKSYSKFFFDELLEDLRTTISSAIDVASHEEREVARLKVFVMELLTQNKVLTYQVRRLRERIKELEIGVKTS
ncbi:MAG: hypothetical protein ACFFFG_16710 [Candidatus Thorarchaeota archaeon]